MEPEEIEGLNDDEIHKKVCEEPLARHKPLARRCIHQAVEDAEEYLSELDGNKDGFLVTDRLTVTTPHIPSSTEP